MRGGRGGFGVGLVEVEGRAVWGGPHGVYVLDEVNSKWESLAEEVSYWTTLAVFGGELVYVGGKREGASSKEVMALRKGRWTSMSDMLLGCWRSRAISISGRGLVVMGGYGDNTTGRNIVQVFNGRTCHYGPPLPQPCALMSAVVHGDQVFVMGGWGMERAVWSANVTDLVSH